MKKKIGNILFCILFCALCLVPFLGMLLFGPSQAGSNEVLSKKPSLLEKSGGVNRDYLSELSAWFGDHFALRQGMITANAAMTAAVFQESAADNVILGRNGWLYYGDTLADFEGAAPMTERQLWCAAHTLALMQEYAASKGCAFLFTVAPNKNTLYPDAMPDRYEASAAASNLDRLTAVLAEEGVSYCDLLSVLAREETPVYYKTDSHWTGYGSALAHDALLAALGRETHLAEEDFRMTPHLGDLYEMLYPAGRKTEDGLTLRRDRTFSYVGTVRGPDDLTIQTTAEDRTGSLLMFRDSFGNTLHADLAEDFGAALFSRSMPYDLTLLDQTQADTLMVEIVERNLVNLAEKPPVMPGLVRELEIPVETVPAQVQVESAESLIAGCVHYSATLEADQIDPNSPVWLVLDGTVYEAVPTASGFSLHGPAAEQISVLVRSGGRLVLLEEP